MKIKFPNCGTREITAGTLKHSVTQEIDAWQTQHSVPCEVYTDTNGVLTVEFADKYLIVFVYTFTPSIKHYADYVLITG